MAPKNKTKSLFNPDKMLLSKDSSFSVQEAYKTLRTNVTFSLPGNESKCIGITSAYRGDGKSSVAINLAIAFAQIKKKVIIIDCDMRIPTVASKIGIDSKPGLSDYLAGTNNMDDTLIRKIPEYGIDVLPSGTVPPDPTILLESPQMQHIIEILKKYYDYIILDFPPVAVVSDAAIMSKSVDGFLIIVRHNTSEYTKVEETLRQLEFADAKIIGFVYNAKELENIYKGSKRYYYRNYYKTRRRNKDDNKEAEKQSKNASKGKNK